MKADVVSTGWRDLVTISGESGRFHLGFGDNSIFWYYIDSVDGLDSRVIPIVGQWYHVVGTHQGTAVQLYVDGDLKVSGTAGASTIATDLKVGSDTEVFDGQIDEVQIFNRALTPEQVKGIYEMNLAEE